MIGISDNSIIELLKREVKPALGCTEPVAVSLAVARASEEIKKLQRAIEKIDVEVSANILKNGMGVGVPGTGMVGLHIAAALGVTCGKSEYKLEVLKEIDEVSISNAKKMVTDNLVNISLATTNKKLFIKAVCLSGNHKAEVIIEDNHDSITSIIFDDKTIFSLDQSGCDINDTKDNKNSDNNYALTVERIWEFTNSVNFKEIEFILESEIMNRALSDEGLKNIYGLQVGRTIKDNIHKNIFGEGLLTYSMAVTAAASDARMAGSTLPAMSNSGSGNQGITVTLPVIAASDKLGSTKEELARALILSNLIAIHIKHYLGKLSALCGCVIASTGASCGIVLLRGGNYKQITYAIKNMIGNITGMVCDGAKVGCALKVASGVSSSVQSSILALDNICISDNDGIIEEDIEKTIRNLGLIGSEGMKHTDNMILDIMVSK
ncbi:MAG: L-serine ammonia-lyase, iron-sulfur-dependent, subunit alpha [Bacteroidales bacterium]|jgi:L-cysteine desulfidase|nr:L-serine ammonia-lyase, iron-sulfur-dependent, subunit alpha [Bacteroidales bacterium]